MNTHPALINPPADVQAAVAEVVRACHGWAPTQVPDLPLNPPLVTVDHMVTTEADVCNLILHPYEGLWAALWVVLFFVLVLALFGWAVQIHRWPGALWRMASAAVGIKQGGRLQ